MSNEPAAAEQPPRADGDVHADVHADVHHLRVDDPRCGCGTPREACVRDQIRALFDTSEPSSH
jgi:hypothetical protein